MRRACWVVLVLSLASALARADEARIERGWLTIRFPAGREALAEHVMTLAGEGPSTLKAVLDLDTGPATIRIVEREADLRDEVGGYVPPWALAVALSSRRLIVVRADKLDVNRNQLGPTLTHELAHLAMGRLERRANRRLPRWFEEGVCEWVSGQAHFGVGRQLALDAALGKLFAFDELAGGFPPSAHAAEIAYSQSRAFVGWIESTHRGALRATLARFGAGAPFADALKSATGQSQRQLEQRWRRQITPRHPTLFALSHLVEAGTVMAVLCVLAYWRRRRKDRRILAELPGGGEEERAVHGWRGPAGP